MTRNVIIKREPSNLSQNYAEISRANYKGRKHEFPFIFKKYLFRKKDKEEVDENLFK